MKKILLIGELIEDLIQIIIIFSCKLQGEISHKTKRMIKEIINENKKD